ncbi:MAG: helix-turn-helix transcriptional regulator [Erysipelotrichaceae bacterium]|nr:helix-turn-helix transcriptional regulator [Erysipelotrichaceae bacterium]
MKLSEFCRKLRNEKGLGIIEYSKDLGCSHSYISIVESGKYDDPSPLNFAKVILKYDLDIETVMEEVDSIDYNEEFISEVKRHLYRNIGTKIVINKRSMIKQFKDEYLFPNGYKDIDKSVPEGDALINQAVFDPVSFYSANFVDIEISIRNESITIYPRVDYVCYKENKLCFVCILDITSTIAVNVDKYKITAYVRQLLMDIAYGYFEVKNSKYSYDVILLTPSEKIYNFIVNDVFTKQLRVYDSYQIGVAMVRQKRKIKGPSFWTNSLF